MATYKVINTLDGRCMLRQIKDDGQLRTLILEANHQKRVRIIQEEYGLDSDSGQDKLQTLFLYLLATDANEEKHDSMEINLFDLEL